MIASYISEVVLALEPWAARLKMPMITPGAASNEIASEQRRSGYNSRTRVAYGWGQHAIERSATQGEQPQVQKVCRNESKEGATDAHRRGEQHSVSIGLDGRKQA